MKIQLFYKLPLYYSNLQCVIIVGTMQYWLVKNERDCYSIDDFRRDRKTAWTEVRNYQARNFLRQMKKGDAVLYYHSNAGTETGVVGEATVIKEAYPDPTQFDSAGEYYDAASTSENPRWSAVDLRFKAKYPNPVYLRTLKTDPAFRDMLVTKPGTRLSVTPVSAAHFKRIQRLSATI